MTDIQKAIATLNDCDEYSLRHHSGEIQTVIEGYDAAQSELSILHGLCEDRFNELAALREELARYQAGHEALYDRMTAAEQRNAELESELFTLKHAVWHMLDDSGDGEVDSCKSIMTHDFEKLCELVPEEWHESALNPTESGASE